MSDNELLRSGSVSSHSSRSLRSHGPPPVSGTAPARAQAIWTHEDETILLEYLIEHRTEGGMTANFRKPTFNNAAAEILSRSTNKAGKVKTGPICQTKFAALKRDYKTVKLIKGLSGFSWNDERGADIGPSSEAAWRDLAAKNKAVKPFRRKGFKLYDMMDQLMPTNGSGEYAYAPGSATPAIESPSSIAIALSLGPTLPSTYSSVASTTVPPSSVPPSSIDTRTTTLAAVMATTPPLPPNVPGQPNIFAVPPFSAPSFALSPQFTTPQPSPAYPVWMTGSSPPVSVAPGPPASSPTPGSILSAPSSFLQPSSESSSASGLTSVSRAKCKHDSATSPATSTSKKSRSTASRTSDTQKDDIMAGLRGALEQFNVSLNERGPVNLTNDVKEALRHIQMDGNLSDAEVIHMTHVFHRSPLLAGIYLSLTKESLRRAWLTKQLLTDV